MLEFATPTTLPARLRPASRVMQLERLGSLHASRLSFVRSLVRQMARQRWQISCTHFDLDANGRGTAIYRLQTPQGRYHGVIFSQHLEDAERSDRVIAQAWDVTFGVVEGDVDEAVWERLKHLATRMLVEATEASREGAGANDND